MVSKKEIARLEKSSVRLSITVDKSDVKKTYDALVKSYAKEAQIKGFRKGHVPVNILEAKFGPSLKAETLGRVMEDAVEEALKDDTANRPLPYSQPRVDGDSEPDLDFGKDLSFSVVYDVFPTVLVSGWSGIQVEEPKVEIGEADYEKQIEELRERNALVIDKEEGKSAAKGDVATIDYVELDDSGAETEGTAREGFVFTIGSGMNLYSLDEDVTGMKKGDSKTVAKTFPSDYQYADLAGKKKTLKVTLSQLKARKLPDLDDDFAQDISEKYKTVADLKADIRSRLEAEVADKLRNGKELQVIDELIARSTIEVPESMIALELEGRYRDFMGRIGSNEATLERLLAASGKSRDSLMAEWRPLSEKAIKTRLILEKLVADEKLEATDADLDAEFAKIAARAGVKSEDVKAQYEQAQYLERLRDHIMESKLFDKIYAAGKVKAGKKVAFVDFMKENE